MAGLPHPFYGNPPAYMGYVGFIRLLGGGLTGAGGAFTHNDMIVRATSADLALKQEISSPEVIDSRYDKTVYQLGPKTVEGTIAFPAVYDLQGGANIVDALYRYAVIRDPNGLMFPLDFDVKYAVTNNPNVASFQYQGCIVNTFQFSVTQSEVVNISSGVIGLNRTETTEFAVPSATQIQNTRIVTWADARVQLYGGALSNVIGGQYVRNFEININNNAERYYTLNKYLFPQAIAPRKRDINGSIGILGRHNDLGALALSNEERCSESTKVAWGFQPDISQEECNSSFVIITPNVVFQIEEMSLTNDLFETTVNFISLPAAGTGIDDPLDPTSAAFTALSAGFTFDYGI